MREVFVPVICQTVNFLSLIVVPGLILIEIEMEISEFRYPVHLFAPVFWQAELSLVWVVVVLFD